jgi:hypothetical protein
VLDLPALVSNSPYRECTHAAAQHTNPKNTFLSIEKLAKFSEITLKIRERV